MQRRLALKAMAGSLFLPSLIIPRERKTPIDLNQFCERGSGWRYDLTTPFEQSGMTYATDSRVCVRIHEKVSMAGDEERNLPKAPELDWGDVDRMAGWKEWPAQSLIHDDPEFCVCPMCDGVGRHGSGISECQSCYGIGEIPGEYFEVNGRFHKCKKCQGTGNTGGTICGFCEGYGEKTGIPNVQLVGGLRIGGSYDLRVRTLPGAEYKVDQYFRRLNPHLKGVTIVIRLRFAGGEGLLMPLVDR